MNKKIFTLFAVSLMLFTTVFAVNAQSRWYGNPVRSVPVVKSGEKADISAYQLVVSSPARLAHKGDLLPSGSYNYAASGYTLSMDADGFLRLVDSTYLNTNWYNGNLLSGEDRYRRLRETLWCSKVSYEEERGQRPGFHFTNREYGAPLAVSSGYDWAGHRHGGFPWPGGIAPIDSIYRIQTYACEERVMLGGEWEYWSSSWVYTGTMKDSMYLRIQIGDPVNDEYLTFINDGDFDGNSQGASWSWNTPSIKLAKVKGDVFNASNSFYQDTIVRFTLSSAAPRVLTRDDINTKLWTRTLDESATGVKLEFDPAPTTSENVFGKTFVAEDPTGGTPVSIATRTGLNYVKLRVLEPGYIDQYIKVLDGDNMNNYYNDEFINHLYPKIAVGSYAADKSDFRFVYYPSEDSVAVNVYSINSKERGEATDPGTYGDNGAGLWYNWTIKNNLIVRLQNLRAETVLTVRDIPNNLRVHFGIAGCDVSDHRANVPEELYIIRDSLGRVLHVPLWAGDLTPRWEKLDEEFEDPHYMPSCQWLVIHANDKNPVTKVHLINREFEYIRLEYLQVYDTLRHFNPVFAYSCDYSGKAGWYDYSPATNNANALIAYDKDRYGDRFFEKVTGKFRTDSLLGYKNVKIDTDSTYEGYYSFRYLHNFTYGVPGSQLYLGVGETNKTKTDTALYVQKDRTFFELSLNDNLANNMGGTEKYGIGWMDNTYKKKVAALGIKPLERAYYTFKISDYFRYTWNDNYLVLEENGTNARYVYTRDEWAKSRKLRYAKFYLRSTYQTAENGDDADKGKLEYYALLDRIERTDFHYFTEITGLTLTRDEKDLWYEASHDPWAQNYAPDTDPNPNQSVGFGVLKMAVHDNSGRVGGEVKVSTPRVSTFDIQPISEPLYRRFNKATEDLSDDPDTLMFYRARTDNGAGSKNYLYEDQHSIYSYDYAGVGTSAYGNGISFLGQINNKQDLDNEGKDKVYPHNFAIYVDTAYVNRGTGWIKPQYLLVVDPKTDFGYNGCPTCAPGADTVKYVYGRYLRNQADSAWVNGAPNGRVLKDTYIWKTQWNRLSFVNAIHALDTLYILNEQTTVDPVTGDVFDPIKQYYSNYQAGVGLQKTEVIDDPNNRVNFKKLYSDGIASGKVKAVPLNNNKHKDEVFSFRFVERQIDSDGNEIKDASKEFLIESESTNRTTRPVIAPMEGGWIKIQDYVPVITRGAYRDVILQAEVFNVEKSEKAPVANETVAAATEDVKVISGKGSVTILNGAGKQVLISNLLGQTVVRAVLTSDQVTLDAPQGVVVVTIDGNAVKAVVK